MARSTLLAVALLAPATAVGGHGFTDAFTDIEWLPPPGATPADPGYFLDGWHERLQALRTRPPPAKMELLLAQAREKIAEAAAMIRSGDRAAAGAAIDGYAARIADACRLSATADGDAAEALAARLAEHLLQHQYIVSVEYPHWPAATRDAGGRLVAAARECYDRAVADLSRPGKDMLFFKEAEVRWSWTVAQEADEAP